MAGGLTSWASSSLLTTGMRSWVSEVMNGFVSRNQIVIGQLGPRLCSVCRWQVAS